VIAFQYAALLAVAVIAPAVVLTRDPLRQAFVLGIFGSALTLLFMAFQSPDVALSAMVITTVGLPVMVLLALRRIRQDEAERREEQDA
jgi:uncharacterized MnhB-related membrane protein